MLACILFDIVNNFCLQCVKYEGETNFHFQLLNFINKELFSIDFYKN